MQEPPVQVANFSQVRTRLGIGLAALAVVVGGLVAVQGESPTIEGVPRAAVVVPAAPEGFTLPATLDPLPSTTTTPPSTTTTGPASLPGEAVAGAASETAPVGAGRPAASRRPGRQPTGFLEIPAIGLRHDTYEGIDLATINLGPSHWPGTALPGQKGNTVFPGHRTTYSRPFYDIDRLRLGDQVIFTNPMGRFVYEVTQTLVVSSRDTWIVNPTPDATMTIFACHPKGSARQRYVAKGRLISAPAAQQPAPPPSSASPPSGSNRQPPPPPTTTTTTPPQEERQLVGGLLR